MKNKLLIIVIFLIFPKIYYAQELSKEAKIYVIVCSPGTELYQAFGHNAFWVLDETQKIDLIFHYGTFNFNDPNFYTKFIKGQLDYMLSIEPYEYFINEYTLGKRDVWKLELNITHKQASEMFKYLMWKSKEENKYYKYDFFMDNCATRIRDLLEQIYKDSLIYSNYNIKLTYREALKPYLRAMPWTRFGINLILGLPADKKIDYYSAMFLPDFVDTVYSKATIISNKHTEKLVKNREYMIKSNFSIGKKPLFNPTIVFWGLFAIISIFTFIETRNKHFFKSINFGYLIISGIVGIVVLLMWVATDHTPTKWNLNILWACPFHLYMAFVYLKAKKTQFIKYYLLIFSIINIALVLLLPIFPQKFDPALIPLLLIFSIRFGIESKFVKK